MGRPVSQVFVGRDAELVRLNAALDAATAGQPSIAILAGEAGVGKTRLVRTFADRLADRAWLRYGRCVPVADGELPFAPFVEAFRPLFAGADSSRRSPAVAFTEPVGDLATLALGPLPVAGWTVQSRLFEHLLEEIRRESAARPLVLVVEDLHWADQSSRELLLFLSRNLRSEPVLLIATYRSDELHRRHPLLAVLSELGRLPAADRIELGRLTPAESADLVQSLAPPGVTAAAINQIASRSEGIPFHAEEILAATLTGQRSRLTPSLAETLTVRLASLPPQSLGLVRTAAAIGRQADHGLLANVTGLDDRRLSDAVRPAVDHHILDVVEAEDRSWTGYEFRHALLAEAAYGELLPAERAATHRAIADALEAADDHDQTTRAVRKAEIAFHWERAHDSQRALAAAVVAGLAADQVNAPAEALVQYRRALDHWQDVPRASDIVGMSESELLGRAAVAAYAAGDSPAAARLVDAALEVLPRTAPVEQRARLYELLHLSRWDLGDAAGARAALDAGLALAPASTEPRARARLLSYAAWRDELEDDFESARQRSEEAVALARGTGEAGAEHLALFSLGATLLMTGEIERGEQLVRRVAEAGDVSELAVMMSRVRLADLQIEAGRPTEAAAAIGALMSETRALGIRGSHETRLASTQADALLGAGDLAGADLALDAATSAGDSRVLVWPYLYRVWVRLCQGDIPGAAAALATSEEFVSSLHNEQVALRFVRALVAHAEGRFADGRQAIGEIVAMTPDLRFDTIPLALVTGIQLEADLAVSAAARRRPEVLADARRVGAGYADLMVRAIDAAGERGRMPKLVGLAAQVVAERTRLDGNADAAAFDEAARCLDLAGRIYDAAQCRFRAAEAILETGGQRSAAETRLRAAWQTVSEIGAAGLRRDIEELAARSRIDLEDPSAEQPQSDPRIAVPADPYGLTRREQAVLALLAAGHSNRQIAQRLFIAESTAGVHVSNIIGKLGVHGRAGAAAIGVRLGLVAEPRSETT